MEMLKLLKEGLFGSAGVGDSTDKEDTLGLFVDDAEEEGAIYVEILGDGC